MRWLSQLQMRVRMLFSRDNAASSLDDELRFHLDHQIAENIAAGMNPEEAHFAALRTFGNPALLREQTRATWSWNSLESFLRDIRYGVRTLRRTPGFTAIAVIVMALGIGANVALFTVVRSVLLKPLPFADPDRLVMLYERVNADSYNVIAGGVYAEWKKQNTSFSDLAIVGSTDYGLIASGGQLPEKVHGASASWDLLKTLGVKPAYGRDFNSADDTHEANGTALLGWSLWQRRFGGDPSILNKTINLDGKSYTVVGIMPSWFAFPDSSTQIWTPVYNYAPPYLMKALDIHNFRAVGQLLPGVSMQSAIADLSVISRRLHEANLDNPFVFGAANGRPLLDSIIGNIKRSLYVLLAATACVLLIACLNVANLLVARAAARRKELAIRSVLGGGRWRLLRERLMESFLLSAVGGACGLLLAYGALAWLVHARHNLARIESIHIDGVVAAFTIAIVVLCALFSGLISAWSANDKQVLTTLHESSRGYSAGKSRSSLRKVLLSLEVGLTVVLLTGAGLLLRSYERLRSTDLGCTTQNVLTMRLMLPSTRYKTPPTLLNFYDTLLARVRALPGIDAASFVTAVPGQGYWGDWGFTIVEHPPLPLGKGLVALDRTADAGYFNAMGIPILRGRTFDANRRLDQANEVVISESLARQFFPGEDPIGKHIHVPIENKTSVIVGIVGDIRYSIGEAPRPMQYYSLAEGKQNGGTLVIRSSHDVEQMALPVQRIIQEMDHDLPVSDVLTMDQMLGKSTLDESFNTTLFAAFATLSLLLAAVGLFGVLSYIVTQRTSEIGIRIALGARRDQVLRIVMLDGLRPALIGLAFGLVVSAACVRLMRSLLYETQPLDPMVFSAVSATLLAVAALACLVPAWRASRLDPMQALRTE
ncbi:MAG TPA: ABC transporter permease [Terracidiphilus sp.]|nr:ABC transporter permease [Terracidiphilus sp.]